MGMEMLDSTEDRCGAGSGANEFGYRPDFGEKTRRPLTKKVNVSAAILSPYRLVDC